VIVPAGAAPADDCSAPTRTVAGATDGSSITVAAGEVVALTGTHTGGVDALPTGGTLCVTAGATLAPQYLNNATGTIYVAPAGTITMPSIAVGSGFVLDVAGTATFAGLNVNGPASLHVAAGASLTVTGQFTPAAGTILNEGTLSMPAGGSLNTGVTLSNVGTLTTGGTLTVNGPLENTGVAQITGDLLVNGSGTLHNLCVLTTSGSLTNGSSGSGNTGIVALGGTFTNSGTWRQPSSGALTASTLTDDGTVSGFGRYVFSGATSVQGAFVGDSAGQPIQVDTPSSQPIFDVQTGTVANVVRADLTLPPPADYPAPDCADPSGTPSADLLVAKSGPVQVDAGGTLTYTVTVVNAGPDTAVAVVVTDDLPAGFTPVSSTPPGALAGSQLTWSLGDLADGATQTMTITGTAPATGPITNTVTVSSSTPDPDGSTNQDSISTAVRAPTPPGPAPVAQDLDREGPVNLPIYGALVGTSSVPDVQLRFAATSSPVHGRVLVTARGSFFYLPERDYLGEDTFTFEVCDNQDPVQCDSATVTLTLVPRAVDDETTTRVGVPVDIPIAQNDTPTAVPSTTLVSDGTYGRATIDPATGTARYETSPAFTGTDQFVYATCAPTLPSDCATAIVTVHVVPANDPPQAPVLTLETETDVVVAGDPAVTDPDTGDTLTVTSVTTRTPGNGAATGSTTVTYTPTPGFAGRDLGFYTVCDDGLPPLCATGLIVVIVDPVATDDTATTAPGTPVAVDVLGNDRGNVLDPAVQVDPAHGTVNVAGGVMTYTPEPGFTGTDTFTYRICAADLSGICTDATVTITVAAPVDPGPGPVDPEDPGSLGGTGTGGGSIGQVLATTGATLAGPLGTVAALLVAGALLATVPHRPRLRRR
jgi:uncharacterized repeat protein (TIGR01451 family)